MEEAMRPAHLLAITLAVVACSESPVQPGARRLAPESVRFHVGYKGPDVPYGFVTNDAECHVGKRGLRWPQSEWYDVKDFDAQLVTTPSGHITMVCSGDIPDGQPIPSSAEVEQAVLCFLPNQLDTRDAQEVFTPSGKIILTCHYNPNGE
jgi:hypothetical protein